MDCGFHHDFAAITDAGWSQRSIVSETDESHTCIQKDRPSLSSLGSIPIPTTAIHLDLLDPEIKLGSLSRPQRTISQRHIEGAADHFNSMARAAPPGLLDGAIKVGSWPVGEEEGTL